MSTGERIHSYPKIWSLGHPAIDTLFEFPVTVEEKVDGSQFSFQRRGDTVAFRSKRREVFPGSAEMFEVGTQAVTALRDLLKDGWVYRGEFLAKPKHNSLVYARVPAHHVVIWDIETGPNRFLGYREKAEECERIGFEVVPLVHCGMVADVEALLLLMDRESMLGLSKVEGLVFKSYEQFGADGKILTGKHVCEAFKETNHKTHKKTKGVEIKQEIGDYLRTEARFAKAAQRMRDQGELANSPRDIGPLIKEIQQDVEAECVEEIKDMLWRWARKEVIRASSRGAAEWYKQQLMARQFEDTP